MFQTVPLMRNSDYFKVANSNPRLKAKDVDGDAIWYSESVDISCRTDVSFFIYARIDADMESSDFIKIEYRLDDTGGWIQATTNGYLPGNGTESTFYDVRTIWPEWYFSSTQSYY